ncbi:MAG: hypothetical protein KDD33_07235 [Bdellovibrionales bacterium]|nr:hypothetical protein [Bdellovibrionales bacterium]
MRSLIFALIFTQLTLAAAADKKLCKEQMEKVKESCAPASISSSWTDAFNKAPINYQGIFKTMQKCTDSVALCYHNCGNQGVKKGASVHVVTTALKKSYGKKPLQDEVIECRGSLDKFAKVTQSLCEENLIKEKDKLAKGKEYGLQLLAQRCENFSDFKNPEDEGAGDYWSGHPEAPQLENAASGESNEMSETLPVFETTNHSGTKVRIGQFKPSADGVGEFEKIEVVAPIPELEKLAAGKGGNQQAQGAKLKKTSPLTPITNTLVNPLALNSNPAKFSPSKKKSGGKTILKKEKEQLAGHHYVNTEGIKKYGASVSQASSTKEKASASLLKGQQGMEVLKNKIKQDLKLSYRRYQQGTEQPIDLNRHRRRSLFYMNRETINSLRENQMTIE